MTKIKLSELTYEFLVSLGLPKASMHTDSSDGLRSLYNAYQTEQAKKELSERYGDVTLIVDPDADWYKQIQIDDAKWKADHVKYCEDKAAWCAKYGCD